MRTWGMAAAAAAVLVAGCSAGSGAGGAPTPSVSPSTPAQASSVAEPAAAGFVFAHPGCVSVFEGEVPASIGRGMRGQPAIPMGAVAVAAEDGSGRFSVAARWRNLASVPDEIPPGAERPLPRTPGWPPYDPLAPQTVKGLWSVERIDGPADDIRSLDASAESLSTWPRENAPIAPAAQQAQDCLAQLGTWTRVN